MKLKSTTAIAVILSLVPAVSMADPTYMAGLAFNFGGGKAASPGVTFKILSDDQAERIVGSLGVTYFLDNGGYVGVDVGAAYLFEDDFAAGLSYDFINARPQVSVGYADVC